jgi:hypothetical protein
MLPVRPAARAGIHPLPQALGSCPPAVTENVSEKAGRAESDWSFPWLAMEREHARHAHLPPRQDRPGYSEIGYTSGLVDCLRPAAPLGGLRWGYPVGPRDVDPVGHRAIGLVT